MRRFDASLAGTIALGGGIVPPGLPGVQWSVAAELGSISTDAGRAGAGSVGGSRKAGFDVRSSESRRLSAFASR